MKRAGPRGPVSCPAVPTAPCLRRRLAATVLALLLAIGAVACSGGSDHKAKPVKRSRTTSTSVATSTAAIAPSTSAPATAPPSVDPAAPGGDAGTPGSPAPVSVVAQASNPQTTVYDSPGGAAVETLDNPIKSGAPLVFLVVQQQPDWLQVMLPTRPNGSTGWIRAADATLTTHNFRIDVVLSKHLITVMQGPKPILQAPIAVGTSDTPTPEQTFYITELIKPTDGNGTYIPDGDYGPYAYGLSGHSDVLQTFGGGDGQLGIHGTNAPQLIGTDVSHGCIRMSNDNITTLADILPLGVPVRVFS